MKHRRSEAWVAVARDRCREREGRLLTLTNRILLLIKTNETAVVCPALNYNSVCCVSCILYCSLATWQSKTKFCLGSLSLSGTHSSKWRECSPSLILNFSKEPKSLSCPTPHPHPKVPLGLVLAVWLSLFPGLSPSPLAVLFLGESLFFCLSPRSQPLPSPPEVAAVTPRPVGLSPLGEEAATGAWLIPCHR